MSRFKGFQGENGLYVLDQVTGEVIFIGKDKKPILVRQAVEEVPAEADVSLSIPEQVPLAVAEQKPHRDPFDDEVIRAYPYPIAKTYLDFLNEQDPRQKCKLMVDTFTSVLKLWALQIASEYLQARGVKDPNVNQTLARDFARPLISAWNLMLFRALPVLEESATEPFIPELRVAYRELESKCREKFILESEYEDADGNIKKKKSKLAVIQALIKYRNSLAHGFNQSPATANKDMETYIPLFTKVLKAGRFMKNYPLYYIDTENDQDTIYRLMGIKPQKVKKLEAKIDKDLSPLFIHNSETGKTLPMFSFFDVGSSNDDQNIPGLGRDVLLFEGNTKSAVIYVSSTGGHFEKQSKMKYWKELLAEKAIEVKVLDPRKVNLETLKIAANRVTHESINKLISSGKYLREATINRSDLEEHLNSFENGDFRGFLLGGGTGIGKSTLFARYVEERQLKEDVVLFYRASSLLSTDLSSRILRDMGVKNMFFEDFLSLLDDLFKEQEICRFRLVIDAVNEHPNSVQEFVKNIDQIVGQAESYPWFRLVASIRNSAYERLPQNAQFSVTDGAKYYLIREEHGTEVIETPLVSLAPIGKELLPAMYAKYREFQFKDPDDLDAPGIYRFRPKTNFNDLDEEGSTISLMSHPMMMRIILAAYHQKSLPDQLHYDAVMRLYFEEIIEEKNSSSGSFPERKAFLRNLVKELDKLDSDSISRDKLYKIPIFIPTMTNLQKDSAYIQLLDLGIIMEEWDNDECRVRFCFDRLFEFMLAELHEDKIESEVDLLILAKRAGSFKNLQGTLSTLLLRQCAKGNIRIIVDALDLCDPDKNGNINPGQKTLISSVLDLFEHLARAKDPAIIRILKKLNDNPSFTDVDLLIQSFDRFYFIGEINYSEKIIDTAYEASKILNNKIIIAETLVRKAKVLNLKGELIDSIEILKDVESLIRNNTNEDIKMFCDILLMYSETAEKLDKTSQIALNKAESAVKLAREHGFTKVLANGLLSMARIQISRAKINLAIKILEEVEIICKQYDHRNVLARTYITLSHITDDELKKEKLIQESFKISEELGNRLVKMSAFYSLGYLWMHQGKFTKSKRVFKKILNDSIELGIKKDEAYACGNLATIHLRLGENKKAETLFRRDLELHEEMKDESGAQVTSVDIANILKFRGNEIKARKRLIKAKSFFDSKGDRKGLAFVNFHLARFYFYYGKLDKAEKINETLLKLAQELIKDGGNDASYELLFEKCNFLLARGNVNEANEIYNKALNIKEEGDSFIKGILDFNQGEFDEAIIQFTHKEKSTNNIVEKSYCHYYLGRIEKIKGNNNEASKFFKKVNKAISPDTNILLFLGNLSHMALNCIACNDIDLAEKVKESFIENKDKMRHPILSLYELYISLALSIIKDENAKDVQKIFDLTLKTYDNLIFPPEIDERDSVFLLSSKKYFQTKNNRSILKKINDKLNFSHKNPK